MKIYMRNQRTHKYPLLGGLICACFVYARGSRALLDQYRAPILLPEFIIERLQGDCAFVYDVTAVFVFTVGALLMENK